MNAEDVARFPLPGTSSPLSLAFSPDDNILSYLHAEAGQMTRQLWGVDMNNMSKRQLVITPNDGDTEENLSLEEKLRRERQRQHAVGVTSYFWSSRGSPVTRIMIPLQGNIYVQEGVDTSSLRLVYNKDSWGGAALDPQLSPDGRLVAFVKEGEMYVIPVGLQQPGQLPKPVRLTFGAREGLTFGLADYIAQEEMERFRGFWWSLDSKSIVFSEVDETHIPAFRIMHLGKAEVDETSQEDHHYPFAGKDNPRVRIGVVQVDAAAVESGTAVGLTSAEAFKPVWMDTSMGEGVPGAGGECYLARVNWLQDGSLCAQVQNRAQSHLDLLRLDPATGRKTVLLRESSAMWINLHNMFRCLPPPNAQAPAQGDVRSPPGPFSRALRGGAQNASGAPHMEVEHVEGPISFLWASERSGTMHLYLATYEPGADSARIVRQVTSGDWVVESVVGVDQTNNVVYVMGTYDDPCERHLYACTLTGPADNPGAPPTPPVRLTSVSGTHHVIMDHKLKRFVDLYSTLEEPARMAVYKLADRPTDRPILIQELHSAMDDRVQQLRSKLGPPDIVKFRSRDNAVDLYMGVYRPDPTVHGPGPYPCLVHVYGGPHVQRVSRQWMTTVDMKAQRLRDLGFVVLKCDNRGSSRRGLAFEGWIKHRLGNVEVSDQEDAVRWLVAQGVADATRVGIFGWSYGGYLTAMALCKAPQTFRVGVSGAPVTSWDGYDTHYTERYMGLPQENEEGYRDASVLTHAAKMQGKIMLVHGLIDENVHFRHTARLINALIAARKPYDLLIFPDERHSPRKLQDRVYMEQRISDYLVQHLMREPLAQASHL